MSQERLARALADGGRLHAAPDLTAEALTPGATNERRDREATLKLYFQSGVQEYSIVDWRQRQVEGYRRHEAVLPLAATHYETNVLESPRLPGFRCQLADLLRRSPA